MYTRFGLNRLGSCSCPYSYKPFQSPLPFLVLSKYIKVLRSSSMPVSTVVALTCANDIVIIIHCLYYGGYSPRSGCSSSTNPFNTLYLPLPYHVLREISRDAIPVLHSG